MSQLFIETLSGSTLLIDKNYFTEEATVKKIKKYLEEREGIPRQLIRLTQGNRFLSDNKKIADLFDWTIRTNLRLQAGKGGFGSLLRGQAPKKKLPNTFEACRDLSGRR